MLSKIWVWAEAWAGCTGLLQSFSGWGALYWPNSTRLKQRLRSPLLATKAGRPAPEKLRAGGPPARGGVTHRTPRPGPAGRRGCAPYRRTLPSPRSGAWTPPNGKPSHFFQILSSLQKHTDLLISSSAGGGRPWAPALRSWPGPAFRSRSVRLAQALPRGGGDSGSKGPG